MIVTILNIDEISFDFSSAIKTGLLHAINLVNEDIIFIIITKARNIENPVINIKFFLINAKLIISILNFDKTVTIIININKIWLKINCSILFTPL